MAAAVADFTPITPPTARSGKLRRAATGLVLRLRPTPDLLAGVAAKRRPGQTIVGFALEPASRLLRSAREKLRRKSLDAIVANELRTMNAPTIAATLILADGTAHATPKSMPKADFARWLLDRLPDARAARPLP
jgi:phosphopantothenoylcysteine decarboxylase/phosphopantothenate--cysteine ligase